MTEKRRAPLEVLERLAEAVDEWAGGVSFYPNSSEPGKLLHEAVCNALAAYRAATAQLRSRAEVDAEIVGLVRSFVDDKGMAEEGRYWDLRSKMFSLCREPTSGPGDESAPEDPEACSCDESEGLKRKLLDIRTEYELWETSAKGSTATLSAIGLILRGDP
jgi:hypothetical protein